MWAVAYLLGAGVAIGPDAVLSPFMQAPAPANLPAFPLLAALPDSSTPFAWALPILGAFRLKFKDILPYTFIGWAWMFIVMTVSLFLFPKLF